MGDTVQSGSASPSLYHHHHLAGSVVPPPLTPFSAPSLLYIMSSFLRSALRTVPLYNNTAFRTTRTFSSTASLLGAVPARPSRLSWPICPTRKPTRTSTSSSPMSTRSPTRRRSSASRPCLPFTSSRTAKRGRHDGRVPRWSEEQG